MKLLDKTKWHRWFAWYPVFINFGETEIWMKFCERRLLIYGGFDDDRIYEYREMNE